MSPGSADTAADRSSWLVQESTSPTRTTNRETRTSHPQRASLPQCNTVRSAGEGAEGITITTSLEVASTSPFSTESRNMASRGPATHVDAANSPLPSSEQIIRTSKSADALKKTPPQAFRPSFFDDARLNTGGRSEAAALSLAPFRHLSNLGSSSAKSKLPEFRESRRWAKFHEAVHLKATREQVNEQNRPLTLREASFEQQRAQTKTNLQSRRTVSSVAAKTLSEADSFFHAQGLCRTLSVPSWQVTKTAGMPHPQSLSAKWVARKLSFRRHRRTGSRQSDSKRSVDMSSSTRKSPLKRRLRPKRAVADLGRKVDFTSSTSKLADTEKIVDLDTVSTHPSATKRSTSPLPSLHDPEKAKNFSQECEALLSNADFDQDWLNTSAQPLPALGPPFEETRTESSRRPAGGRKLLPKITATDGLRKATYVPDSTSDIREAPETLPIVAAPEPPVRTSSKRAARFASIVHMSRPACIPILHGSRDSVLVAIGETGDNLSMTGSVNQPAQMGTRSRISSTVSQAGHPSKGPRAVASSDTLAAIEAQVQESTQVAIVEKLKQKTAFIVSSHKLHDASGTPPERPLPALPAPEHEAKPVPEEADGGPGPEMINVSGPQRADSQLEACMQSMGFSQSNIDTSIAGSNRKSQGIAASKGLTIDPIANETSDDLASPPLLTPSSMDSQASIRSRTSTRLPMPLARHDLSRLRPDRTRELKKRVKEDLAREHRISEEDELNSETVHPTDRPLPPVPQTEAHGPIDPLDQFPAVPKSRPTSLVSVSAKRTQSGSRSHTRHSSKASSIRPRHPRQVLETSEIKVLVDTNPVTGRFRAGALSPTPSIAGGSRNGSPRKRRQGLSSTKTSVSISMQEINKEPETKKVLAKKPSVRSLRSQASSRLPAAPKPARRGSGANTTTTTTTTTTDSEDDISPLLSPVISRGARKLRRRRNSNDEQMVQMLSDGLEHCYDAIAKQERELCRQKEEIQMLVRVLACTDRANEMRAAMFPTQHPGFALEKGRVEASSILLKTAESLKAAKHGKKDSQTIKAGERKVRPISHLSSTSATTNVTMWSRTDEPKSMEGSLTDPLEYELPSSASAPAGFKLKVKGKVGVERPRSRGVASALHSPPPVATVLPKGKLQEDQEEERLGVWGEEDGNAGGEGEENRLSVNHVLTDAVQMDKAIEILRTFA